MFERLYQFLAFIDPYPLWVKYLSGVWLIYTVALVMVLIIMKPKAMALQTVTQSAISEANVNNSSGVQVYQAARDVIINSVQQNSQSIASMIIEFRVTCTLKDGAAIPPAEVPFNPIGGSRAYFEGRSGKVALDFISPVRFWRQDSGEIVVINRFVLSPAGELSQQHISNLSDYSKLALPLTTVVYGSHFAHFKKIEVLMKLNGEHFWSYSHASGHTFEKGLVVTVPLDSLHARLK